MSIYHRGGGTLNFYDDSTHREVPRFNEVIECLNNNGMELLFSRREYKPLFYVILGLLNEPRSRWKNHTMKGTWALYGFETVIWAKKK